MKWLWWFWPTSTSAQPWTVHHYSNLAESLLTTFGKIFCSSCNKQTLFSFWFQLSSQFYTHFTPPDILSAESRKQRFLQCQRWHSFHKCIRVGEILQKRLFKVSHFIVFYVIPLLNIFECLVTTTLLALWLKTHLFGWYLNRRKCSWLELVQVLSFIIFINRDVLIKI